MLPTHAIAELGGHASKTELLALGCDETFIKMSLGYRDIRSTRRGWYALPDVGPAVLTALRAGGRLACVSALAWHAGGPVGEPVHVLVRYGVSRPRADGVVLHWTRREVRGSRLVEHEESARGRAATCRARPG